MFLYSWVLGFVVNVDWSWYWGHRWKINTANSRTNC